MSSTTMMKGTTPTFILTLPDYINLEEASNVFVTFSYPNSNKEIVTKSLDDLEIEVNSVSVFLTQEESFSFPKRVNCQINWIYYDNGIYKRASSEVVSILCEENLLNYVLEA